MLFYKANTQCLCFSECECGATSAPPLLPLPGGAGEHDKNKNEIVKPKARKFSLLRDLQRDMIPFPSSHRRHMHLSVTIPAALPRIPSQDST